MATHHSGRVQTRAIACCAIWALGGCAGPQSVGSESPPDFKAHLIANKYRLWKDPDSVRDVSVGSNPWRFLNMGWMVCIRSNAKNSFGGFTGLQTNTLLIYDNGAPSLMQQETIYDGCGRAAYISIPEMDAGYVPPKAAPATAPVAKRK